MIFTPKQFATEDGVSADSSIHIEIDRRAAWAERIMCLRACY